MAQIGVQPFTLTDVKLKVDADNYEKHVSQVEFQPQGGVTTWKGLTPDAAFSFAQTPTWQLVLAVAQDWTTPDSLSRYLFDNQGKTVSATFTPVNGGPDIAADIIITAPNIGGAVDAVAASTVTLGVIGKPTIAAAAGGSGS
ncbi:hypothetical protein Q7F20_07590 [Curtobacterium sp. A7_M15]|uniref:hypothetical protein n=1 Tax=Curtobacterium sp. A7_M15 TaxID=3065241 RepID=UPI002737A51E|nr:hypothetical protein [Curtobacterium sp. A7_M15]MDP4333231.1 hypothetical protein [Curtobacterium sp. A7_M15]